MLSKLLKKRKAKNALKLAVGLVANARNNTKSIKIKKDLLKVIQILDKEI